VQVVGREWQPGVAGRVEPPLQDVALHQHGARHLALLGPLGSRADVDEHRTGLPGPLRAMRVEPEQAGPSGGKQVDD
jgi:hypothetical protein